MRILLLSAYDAVSHRRWRQSVTTGIHADWTVLTLPPRHFSWRIRGNALTWWGQEHAVLSQPWDRLVCTSMVDLATLRGLVPSLARVPTSVYFHENQLEYPTRTGTPDAAHAIHHIYTALCADRVAFNSAWNRDSLLAGLSKLLRRLPDGVPPALVDTLATRATVLPVPIDSTWCHDPAVRRSGPLQILWNHRWEYDKAPDRFVAALADLEAAGHDYALHIVGQSFRDVPPAFEHLRTQFAHRIRTWGWQPDVADYRALLQRCDLVVSTARHEFQGLAVLEAMACGCAPLVPDRLAYREFVDAADRYPSTESARDEVAVLGARLVRAAQDPAAIRQRRAPDLRALRWAALQARYRAWLGLPLGEKPESTNFQHGIYNARTM